MTMFEAPPPIPRRPTPAYGEVNEELRGLILAVRIFAGETLVKLERMPKREQNRIMYNLGGAAGEIQKALMDVAAQRDDLGKRPGSSFD